jgi:hypothetical protein
MGGLAIRLALLVSAGWPQKGAKRRKKASSQFSFCEFLRLLVAIVPLRCRFALPEVRELKNFKNL